MSLQISAARRAVPRVAGGLNPRLAVAGQEPFIADTPEEAWAWVDATHPEDDGAMVQYVRPEKGPRIYYADYR
jgi:hypothetical protein